MANESLTMSEDGIRRLKADEGVIDGLYDDPSGFCTSGVGHLVHQTDKWGCWLLQVAKTDADFKATVLKQWPGLPYETPYLSRGAAFVEKKFDGLKEKAVAVAKEAIAQKRYKKAFDKLDKADQDKVGAAASEAIDEQASLLAKTSDATLAEDLGPFEKLVRSTVTPELTQAEFDALVSFCFNIGQTAFPRTGVVTEINRAKYKAGEIKDRKAAIDTIAKGFAAWNKSDGKELPGLTARRKSEADRFLDAARAELAALEKAAAEAGKAPAAGAPKPVGGPAPVGGPKPVK